MALILGSVLLIAASILNLFFKPIESDVNFQLMIANKMLEREDQPNNLMDFVDKHDLDRKKSSLFKKIDSSEIPDFPKLEPDYLNVIKIEI